MSKFIIECPVCHNYAEASTGFFASKHIRCACGNVINVKTDKMATRNCPSCGQTNITSKFCPECGAKKPEPPKPWDCACGCKGITSKFCPECGSKRPETWDCSCGQKNISSKFCPECGKKRED